MSKNTQVLTAFHSMTPMHHSLPGSFQDRLSGFQ
jgi:hypothetical protein